MTAEHTKIPSTVETAKEHKAADKACGREWYGEEGCACPACKIERDAEIARALTVLRRTGERWTIDAGKSSRVGR